MSNLYCSILQFFQMYDQRTMQSLSGDQNAPGGQPTNIQAILDMEASELESHLANRVTLPLTVTPIPGILTKWVAVKAAGRLFARRNDIPKQVTADLEWATKWIELFDSAMINIPGVGRAEVPTLQDSEYTDGSSRFDYDWGNFPSPTGPTRT